MVMRRGTGRGGPRPLTAAGVFQGSLIQRRRTRQTTAKGADGTSECPGGSPHERGARHKLLTLGHPAGRQIHPRAERRRKDCFRGPGSVDAIFARISRATARVPLSFSSGVRDARLASGRPRKRLFAKAFRTLPMGEARNRKDGLPCGRDEHGPMMRVYVRRAGCARRSRLAKPGCLTIE